jgi:hypothetical protein
VIADVKKKDFGWILGLGALAGAVFLGYEYLKNTQGGAGSVGSLGGMGSSGLPYGLATAEPGPPLPETGGLGSSSSLAQYLQGPGGYTGPGGTQTAITPGGFLITKWGGSGTEYVQPPVRGPIQPIFSPLGTFSGFQMAPVTKGLVSPQTLAAGPGPLRGVIRY